MVNQLHHTKQIPWVVRKSTAHVDTKALNMCRQSKNRFWGIFVVIPQYQKGHLIYVPIIVKIVSSHDVVFGKTFSSALAYTPRPYAEALLTQPTVSYIPYATSYHEQTGDIIAVATFKEGDLVENEHNLA